jgi:uncharacterized Fe-S cluster protein YjdI
MAVEKYSSGDVTVTYDSEICTHAGRCVKGLPAVFDANRKPWVDVSAASAEAIEAQVAKCPSRALKFERS